METDNPYELVKKLDSYSEKGAEYGEELSAIIRFNNFEDMTSQQSSFESVFDKTLKTNYLEKTLH